MKARIVILVCLALILGLSAWLRIVLPYESVMGKEIRFTTVDAYAHVRMSDYEYEHFPETMKFDAFLNYPDGTIAPARPLWSWTIALLAKGLGTTVDLVAAWLPAILGVLVALWVFIIGWLMFGKWAGLIGSLFVAVIPGELIGRTSLGHADHDSIEITLLLLVVLFLILAIKNKWYYAILAGIFIGLYNLNWAGSPLLILMLSLYFLIETIIDKYRNRIDYKIHVVFIITMLLGLVVYLLADSMRNFDKYYALFYSAAVLLPVLTLFMLKLLKTAKPIYYVLSWLGIVVVGVVFLVVVVPNFGFDVYQSFTAFFPQLTGFGSTISEMMPLFWYRGQWDFVTSWAYYGLCLYSGLAGMIYFLYKYWREPYCLLVGMWSILTIILVIIQRRYGIYSAVSMSLYTGYICWVIGKRIAIRQLSRQDRKRGKKPFNIGYAIMTGIVLVLFLFVPNAVGATRTAVQLPYVPSQAWMDGMKWLKVNTPQVDEKKPEYGILSWWDYGYWIVREAKRPVVICPGGGNIIGMSRYLLGKDNENILMPMPDYTEKYKTMEEARQMFRIKYIVIDYQMVTGKLYAIPEGARYTPKDMGDTLIMKLWNTGKVGKWEKVWESQQNYLKDKQLKIFEYKE